MGALEFKNGFEPQGLPEYYVGLKEDPQVVSQFLERFLERFPDANIQIEKFTENQEDQQRRERVDMKLDSFLQAIPKSQPLRPSVKAELIPPYKTKSGQDEPVLEFFVRDVRIDNEEHCIWIRIPDTGENRKTIDELVKQIETNQE